MLLEVESLRVRYGASTVLHGAALQVDDGGMVGLLGRNGMGKTTLVHTIAGFLRPVRGAVQIDGVDVTGKSPEQRYELGITLVPQGHRVFPTLSVGENLQVAFHERGDEPWSIDDVCDHFPILGERWDQRAGLLSGGQQQMLVIGRALVGNGRLVMMDEPVEGLDPSRIEAVADVVRELRRRGTALLLVEQKVQFALDLVDRVDFMIRGEISSREDVAKLRDDPDAVSRHMGLL